MGEEESAWQNGSIRVCCLLKHYRFGRRRVKERHVTEQPKSKGVVVHLGSLRKARLCNLAQLKHEGYVVRFVRQCSVREREGYERQWRRGRWKKGAIWDEVIPVKERTSLLKQLPHFGGKHEVAERLQRKEWTRNEGVAIDTVRKKEKNKNLVFPLSFAHLGNTANRDSADVKCRPAAPEGPCAKGEGGLVGKYYGCFRSLVGMSRPNEAPSSHLCAQWYAWPLPLPCERKQTPGTRAEIWLR